MKLKLCITQEVMKFLFKKFISVKLSSKTCQVIHASLFMYRIKYFLMKTIMLFDGFFHQLILTLTVVLS